MEWISVLDRLPSPGEAVGLTYDGRGIRFGDSYCGVKNLWTSPDFGYKDEIDFVFNKKITHWMLLPKPPKEICDER